MFSFCMYCCKERCAAITMVIFSVFIMLASGGTIYLMHRMKTESYVWDLQSDPLVEQGSGVSTAPSIETIKLIIYWGVIGLSGCTILTGFLGFLTAHLKSCCTISLYSFFTLMLTFILMGTGGFLMTVTVASNMHIQSYCQNGQQSHGTPFTLNFARYFLTFVDDYRDATNDMVKQYMCTPLCPCVQITNRTLLYPKGFNRMDSLNNFEGAYYQFSSCYNDLQRDKRIKGNLSPTMLTLIQTLEDKYQCSGLCEVPTFGFFKDVRGGGFNQTCEKAISQHYNMTLGLLSLGLLVTGLFVFLAFNAQYGLWRRRFSKDKPSNTSKDRHMNYMVEDTSKL